jgi:hypothetical protein
MLSQRRTTSAIALDELKRRNDLESLRKYIVLEGCFPASKDPETSPITLEELKKLVRIWKLNERRNFWKTHSERDEIVSALIQHADQNMNFSPTKKVNLPSTKTAIGGGVNGDHLQPQQSPHSVTALKPAPPSDSKPSAVLSVPTIRNFYGLKYFNREVSTKELTMSGRFFQFPETKDRVDNVVDQWRHEDFDMKDDVLTAMNNVSSANGNNPAGGSFAIGAGSSSFNVNSTPNSSIRNATVSGIKNKVKIVKQRNLAMHLMNFSSHIDLKKTQFNMKNVQTFVSVAESDDPKTVSKCMIALSNIAAEPLVRNILLEMNTMHKITNMLQYLRGKAAHWAAGLLFYYFSCDKESEDRVYNACSVFLQLNGSSKDSLVRAVTLYTLNNLMPCIDRQRIAELIMRILQLQFEPTIVFQDRSLSSTYLTIMQNMAWFTNAHSTLLSLNILELLEKFARFAINQKNNEMALAIAKILQSFLQLPDSASAVVGMEFISILCILFESDYEPALIQALKACVVLSTLPNLRRLVHTTELTKVISIMIINRAKEGAAGVTNALGKEAAKYFCNITFPFHSSSSSLKEILLGPSSSSHPHHHSHHKGGNAADDTNNVLTAETIEKIHIATMERLLEENIHEAVFAILRSSDPSLQSKAIAIRALQNIVSYPSNGYKLSKQCIEPVITFLMDCSSPLYTSASSVMVPTASPTSINSSSSVVCSESYGLGAAYVIYNLATIPLCRNELVEKKVHLKILEFMTKVKESSLKSAFLQILVQLSGSNICIVELLKIDLIHKLEIQIQFVSKNSANKSPKRKKEEEEQENLDISTGEGKSKEKEIEILNNNGVWRDISLMLLAVVAYTSHDLTEANQIAIISILKQICSFPGINNDIIENCANVLKFISSRYAAFNELDPVIRSVLALSDSENDETIDNDISTILYNMTCYDAKNLDLMLKDTYYINIMIRIMRNGKVAVQENIAYAIRTLCSVEKCTQLLLKHDIISDLIVIALLRTSSEEIKIVCSQAFYNMLCSSKCRLELLKGDLWWALTRLGRTDSVTVRNMCIRALNDLSAPLDSSFFSSSKLSSDQVKNATLHKSCVLALRSHHVLSFMKDLTLASPASSLLQCLQIVHNFLKQFAQFHDASSSSSAPATVPLPSSITSNPYAVHEVVAAIRIASDAINRSSDIQCIRFATILLLKCSQLHFNNVSSSSSSSASVSSSATTIETNPNNNMIDNEFINIDITEVLRLSVNNWKGNSECRANISRLLYELGKRKFFLKLVPLSEMNEILVAVYNPTNPKENSIEMLENVIGFLLQFILSENVKPIEIIQLTIWPLLLKDSLSTNSSLSAINNPLFFLKPTVGAGGGGPPAVALGGLVGLSGVVSPAPPAIGMGSPSTSLPKGRVSLYQRESSMANTESFEPLRGVIPTPFRVQGMALILFSYCIEAMLSLLQKHYQKNDGKLSINEAGNVVPAGASDSGVPSTSDISFTTAPSNESEDSLLHPTGSAAIKKRKASSLKDNSDVVSSLLTIHFPSLLQGVIKTDFVDYVYTRNNLLHILHMITQYSTPVIEAVFIPDCFQLILRLLNNSVGSTKYDRIQEYCSCFLRNVAINHNYLLSFIQTPHFQVVNELISELADLAVTNLSLAMDLSIFFYFLSDYLQTPSLTAINNKDEGKMLSPKFALDMINKLLSHQVIANSSSTPSNSTAVNASTSSSSSVVSILSSEENYKVYLNTYYEMININKYTISIILNKYTFHNGVDPLFIQNMYSYLQTNSLVVIPNLMKDVSYKKLAEIKNCLYSEYLQIKEMTVAELLLVYVDNPSHFKPIILINFQENDHIILKLTNSKSVIYEKLETIESISIIVFQKMIIPFEPTTESQYDLHNNMISEEADEDDDKSISNHQYDEKRQENSIPSDSIDYSKSTAQVGPLLQEATPQIREENEEDTDDETSPSQSNTGSRVSTATKVSRSFNNVPQIGEASVQHNATVVDEEDTSNLKSSECRREQGVKDSADFILSSEEINDQNSLRHEKWDGVTSLKGLSISPEEY